MYFVQLDFASLKFIIFIAVLFANIYNSLSSIEHIITLVKSDNKINIIYWLLIKYKKTIKNILISQLYAIVYKLDIKAILKSIIEYV